MAQRNIHEQEEKSSVLFDKLLGQDLCSHQRARLRKAHAYHNLRIQSRLTELSRMTRRQTLCSDIERQFHAFLDSANIGGKNF